MKHLLNLSKVITFSVLLCLAGIELASAAFTVDLSPGVDHPQVKELQQLLNQNGYTVAISGEGSVGQETTLMGPSTVAALKRFQAANNITQSGVVGPLTRLTLNKMRTTPAPIVSTSTSVEVVTAPLFVLTDLYPGMVHIEALTLQRFLNQNGYTVAVTGEGSTGQETTTMGPSTVAALKRFQAANNIAPTGVVGPLTKIAILKNILDKLLAAKALNSSTGNIGTNNLLNKPASTTTPTATTTTTKKKRSGGGGGSSGGGSSLPVATFSASLSSVASGASVTLTWSSVNATSCIGTNFSTASTTSGSVVVNPTVSTTYTLTCTGTGGTDIENRIVTVVPAPVATFSASPSSVVSGGSSTLTWSSTNATICTGTNFSTGNANAGSVVVNPTATTTYTLTCTGTGGTDIEATTVNVSSAPAPVATLSVSSSTVSSGTNVTVTWSSTNATSCTGTNFSTGSATSGSTVVNPTVSTTYTLNCTGVGGSDEDVEVVTVSDGSSTIAIDASASRTSGVAPLAVFFDATGTTDPSTTMPFHDLEYRWNFDDVAGGATWGYGARSGVSSKNEATGGVAAHVFETPGTYNVTLDVIGDSGVESTDLTITVTDPDTVFSGTNTRCISRTGVFTGCPSGAQQVTTTDINTVITHIASGRRILFNQGETWPDIIQMGGINGPGIIGSYGTGLPPVFAGLNIGSSGVSDWRVMDLDFVRPTGELYTTAVEVVHPSSRLTFLRVKATGAGSGDDGSFISFAMNIYDTPSSVNQQVEHAIVDSEITGGRYSFYGAGDKLAFMGNYIQALGGGQHVYRSFYANKNVSSNNTFAGGGDAMGWGPISLVKQHAPDQPGAYSEYLHWSDNLFSPTNVYVSLGIGSENNITDQRPRNVVVERNKFEAQYNSQLYVNLSSGSDYTVRNNLFIMDNFEGTGIQVIEDTTGPATSNAHIYNNTFYKSDGGGQGMTAIQVLDAGVSAVIRNNLGYAPNATNPVMISVIGATDVTESNNSSDTQLRTVSPNFSNATPVTLQHFDLHSGSYGRNSGYAVPIFSDLLNRTRPVGSYDMGALEAQ